MSIDNIAKLINARTQVLLGPPQFNRATAQLAVEGYLKRMESEDPVVLVIGEPLDFNSDDRVVQPDVPRTLEGLKLAFRESLYGDGPALVVVNGIESFTARGEEESFFAFWKDNVKMLTERGISVLVVNNVRTA